ncbi:hypothetical protein GCM10010104_25990 [Streptomyces indiaensis]|uniref:Uncharacterized protein n=1 Tax=Streptomyces indiaensis TaxID=284033 RepID=A0ABN3DH25_9ACTN
MWAVNGRWEQVFTTPVAQADADEYLQLQPAARASDGVVSRLTGGASLRAHCGPGRRSARFHCGDGPLGPAEPGKAAPEGV